MSARRKKEELDVADMLTSREAAARMGRTNRWLRNERRLRRGPPWIVYRGWQPLYHPDDVASWLRNQMALASED